VGRLLSELRDTDVCLMTLEDIDPGLTRFAGLAGKLQSQRTDLHHRHLPDADAHREIVADLSAVESILGGIRHSHITTRDLRGALRKTRKRARKRFAGLHAGGNPHAYHDFRKATKRELYQATFLAKDPHRGDRIKELDRLGECLGHNQDLIVLRETAESLGGLDGELSALIEDRRSGVRAECRRLARSLYGHGS
jgi:CHAD domain-containing protein